MSKLFFKKCTELYILLVIQNFLHSFYKEEWGWSGDEHAGWNIHQQKGKEDLLKRWIIYYKRRGRGGGGGGQRGSRREYNHKYLEYFTQSDFRSRSGSAHHSDFNPSEKNNILAFRIKSKCQRFQNHINFKI